jgi:two-component sensor histidine kinase
LQSETIDNQAAIDAIQESKNRVASMALIHQKLYQGENLASIEMRNYFKTLGAAVLDGFGDKAKGIDFEVQMDKLELDVDSAIPIGLITSELLTNSMKYAFPDRKGKISIKLSKGENNLFELQVKDNGVGQIENAGKKSQKGFGSMLVQLLTAQLGGKIDVSTKNGRATIVQFPQQLKSVV